MPVIVLDAVDLTVARPDRDLFRSVSLTLRTGDRLGLIGINGTGKSTLLRVLAGRLSPDGGEVRYGQGVAISVLDQEAPLPTGTVAEVMENSRLGSPDSGADGTDRSVGGTDPDLAGSVERWQGDEVLERLGMGGHLDRSTSSLSGGEAKRVALAMALVKPCDVLFLDEPTNHLDIDTIEWLEERLSRFRGALILVTHDRHLLDRITSRMMELDRGSWFIHDGGYADYLEARERREVEAASAEAVRRNLARSELAWLRRGAPARTSKPRYRVEQAKALIEARPTGPARPADLHLGYETPRLGDVVVELDGVSARLPDGAVLFGDLELKLDPRERLAIVGPNGAGKTTLLDIMAGEREPDSGSRSVGSTVELGYYRQRADEFYPQARVREIVAGPFRTPDWTDARLLEAFWFDTDTQWATVDTLSGGERRRLQLLTVLARRPNVLLLDEPTNDLDLETLRSLEDFLEDWPGAVVVVSHDRAFLERVAADVLVVDGEGSADRRAGGLEAWEQDRRRRRTKAGTVSAARRPDPAGDDGAGSRSGSEAGRGSGSASESGGGRRRPESGRSSSTLGHLMREADKTMKKLAARKTEIEAELVAAGSDHEALARLGADLAVVSDELDSVEEQWLALAEELEARR